MDQAPGNDYRVGREIRESLMGSATALAWRGQTVNLEVSGQPKVDAAKTRINRFVL
jgi:hypothetical protein